MFCREWESLHNSPIRELIRRLTGIFRNSFYKEELAGDTDNYIHGLALYSGTDVITALRETAREAIECVRRIEKVLEGTGHYQKAWHRHSTGYVHMHLTRGRYRLWELGVGAKPDPTEVMK